MTSTPLADLLRRSYQTLSASYTAREQMLTIPQVVVLAALMKHGPLTQAGIRDVTCIDRSTMSAMLKVIATAGLVINARFERDQRAILVTITPAGRAALLKSRVALGQAEVATLRKVPRALRGPLRIALEAIAASANG